MQINHYVVAPSGYEEDGLKYRRHRLVDKLLQHHHTKNIYWLYPAQTAGEPEQNRKIKKGETATANFIEIGITDQNKWHKYQHKIRKNMLRLPLDKIHPADKHVLWYTIPIYSALAKHKSWDKVVYDCSDSWGQPWEELKGIGKAKSYFWKSLIEKSEETIIKSSHFLFATSPFLCNKIYGKSGRKAILIENGVDFQAFSNTASSRLEDIPFPRLGFVGGLKKKIDFDLLGQLAISRPDYHIVLVGPKPSKDMTEAQRLVQLPNVFAIGGVEYTEVPAYMAALDAGLLPYKPIEYNKAVSPLKLFEYLASGIPVTGYGLPTTEKYQDEGVYFYTHTHDEFIKACDQSIAVRNNPESQNRRREVARHHDWERKLAMMTETVLQSLGILQAAKNTI